MFSNQTLRPNKKNEEDLIWKIKTSEKSTNEKKGHFRFNKNISFEVLLIDIIRMRIR